MGQFDNKTVMITGAAGSDCKSYRSKICNWREPSWYWLTIPKQVLNERAEELKMDLHQYIIVAGDLGKQEDADKAIQKASQTVWEN